PAAAASGEGRAGRQPRQAVGMVHRDLTLCLAISELFPLTNRVGGHQAAKSEKSKLVFTLQRRLSPPRSSSAKPAGAANRLDSMKREPSAPSPSQSTAAT